MSTSGPRSPRRSFTQTLEEAIKGLTTSPGTSRVVATSSLAAALGLLPGCDPGAATNPQAQDALEQRGQEVLAYGQAPWFTIAGKRDTTRSQISYYNEYWRDLSACNSRYGCMAITVFIKVRIKPNPAADISYKKVGVVYKELGKPDPITAVGYYFARHGDGWEEWHVPVKSTAYQGTFTFGTWYEDGASNTYYDDNSGELYALTWKEPYNDFTTLSLDYAGTSARFTATGVSGTLSFNVEDLDYDKELTLQISTDGGTTWSSLGMGAAGDKNKVYWSADLSQDFERWKVDLDLPGSFPSFRYRLVYRHGIVGGARPVEFTLGTSGGISIPKS
jgi:hypothetical protein